MSDLTRLKRLFCHPFSRNGPSQITSTTQLIAVRSRLAKKYAAPSPLPIGGKRVTIGLSSAVASPPRSPRWLTGLLSGFLLTGVSSCSVIEQYQEMIQRDDSPNSTPTALAGEGRVSSTPSPPVVPSPATTSESPASEPPTPVTDTYPDAIKRAEQALTLSQSAQSIDDWGLVAGRWQQAIDLLKAVPSSSENYNSAIAKIGEYTNKRDVAKTKANQPIPTSTTLGSTVVVAGEDEQTEGENATSASTSNADSGTSASTTPDGTAAAAAPSPAPSGNTASGNTSGNTSAEGDGLYLAPIIRRSGGIPVILVTFNGQYTDEMIVDTGASGTVLTQQAASNLGVEPSGEINVDTASAQNVTFSVGRVASINVEGAILENVEVAIAGPDLETGLLGNDFFKNYDVTVKSDVVEFRKR